MVALPLELSGPSLPRYVTQKRREGGGVLSIDDGLIYVITVKGFVDSRSPRESVEVKGNGFMEAGNAIEMLMGVGTLTLVSEVMLT